MVRNLMYFQVQTIRPCAPGFTSFFVDSECIFKAVNLAVLKLFTISDILVISRRLSQPIAISLCQWTAICALQRTNPGPASILQA